MPGPQAVIPLTHGRAEEDPQRPSRRRVLFVLLAPMLLLSGGTAGYMLIEGWGVLDALYMTVITVTTVGYLEVHPLSTGGRAFTMVLALGGVFTLFYAATAAISAIVSGRARGNIWRQRMERTLATLTDHIIVCGMGRMGRFVCSQFSSQGMPFVVIDREASVFEGFALEHGIPLVGDATSDEVLRQAGVHRARVLVTSAASDADNLFITMSARLLNDKLTIVARAEEEGAEKKLVRAGANRVVSPYLIGGVRMTQAVLRPTVIDFLELAIREDFEELQIEEVSVQAGSALAGTLIRDNKIRSDLGIIVVAVKRGDGSMVFNPDPDLAMAAGDTLIVLGHRNQLDQLESLAEA
jgi:voltage-gated potassium channel